MKNLITITLLFAIFSCTNNNKANTEWPKVTTEAKPFTRWWWLGSDVNKKDLSYNLEEMSKAGIGGVEITPIYGVKNREEHYIDYLSPKWMEMLSFTESEAKRLGMKVDMNNGTGWPFGGPDVSIEDAATKAIFKEYKLKAGEQLTEYIIISDEKQKDFAKLNQLIAYTEDGKNINLTKQVSANGKLNWTATNNSKLIALFVGKTLQKVKRAAPGGKGYVLNHFDKEAVKRYLRKFDKAFAQNNTPFPNSFFNDSYEVYGADWTANLLNEFEKRRDYKLQDYFPELLAKGENELSIRVINDYRETIGELLSENFTQVWTEWAHSNGATTKNQAHGSPANLIDLYAAVDIPECESFGISNFNIPGLRKDSICKNNDGDPTTLKYASSAANITGKKYCSSETFTWLTEHFRTSLSQCKPEIDQMFTSGVNHVYFHGSTYSPENADWPGWKFYASVDMSPTNSIWKDAPAFFQYITRIQSFLQEGYSDNDFLYYLPIYDIWKGEKDNYFTTFAIHGMRERLPNFCEGVEKVMDLGYGLDYISDNFVTSTQAKDGALQTIGGTKYKALILPAVNLIPTETLKKVIELAKQGATIIFTEHYPNNVPGLSNLKAKQAEFNDAISQLPKIKSFHKVSINKLGKGKIITGHNYADILSKTSAKNEEFVSNYGGQLIRKNNSDGHHYFMTMLQNNTINNWVTLGINAKSAMFFNPMTGEKGKAALRNKNGQTQVYMQIKPGQSIILKTFNKNISINEKWSYYESEKNIILSNPWQLSFIDSKPAIKERFTLNKLNSWTELNNDTLKINMGTASYSSTFNLNHKDNREYILNLGDVRESAQIKINGQNVDTLFAVPFETNISKFLKEGKNKIEIMVTNLPANRIANLDRRNVEWRIFQEINFVSITYKKTFFNTWELLPSGLLGPVTIREMIKIQP